MNIFKLDYNFINYLFILRKNVLVKIFQFTKRIETHLKIFSLFIFILLLLCKNSSLHSTLYDSFRMCCYMLLKLALLFVCFIYWYQAISHPAGKGKSMKFGEEYLCCSNGSAVFSKRLWLDKLAACWCIISEYR